MKALIRQIISVCLAVLLLFSTLSFHLDLHFCGKHLMDFSLTYKAPSCGLELAQNGQPPSCVMAVMNCCSDVRIIVEGQDGTALSAFDFSPAPAIAWAAKPEVPSLVFSCWIYPLTANIYKDYSPPPLIRNVHLLYETFLI